MMIINSRAAQGGKNAAASSRIGSAAIGNNPQASTTGGISNSRSNSKVDKLMSSSSGAVKNSNVTISSSSEKQTTSSMSSMSSSSSININALNNSESQNNRLLTSHHQQQAPRDLSSSGGVQRSLTALMSGGSVNNKSKSSSNLLLTENGVATNPDSSNSRTYVGARRESLAGQQTAATMGVNPISNKQSILNNLLKDKSNSSQLSKQAASENNNSNNNGNGNATLKIEGMRKFAIRQPTRTIGGGSEENAGSNKLERNSSRDNLGTLTTTTASRVNFAVPPSRDRDEQDRRRGDLDRISRIKEKFDGANASKKQQTVRPSLSILATNTTTTNSNTKNNSVTQKSLSNENEAKPNSNSNSNNATAHITKLPRSSSIHFNLSNKTSLSINVNNADQSSVVNEEQRRPTKTFSNDEDLSSSASGKEEPSSERSEPRKNSSKLSNQRVSAKASSFLNTLSSKSNEDADKATTSNTGAAGKEKKTFSLLSSAAARGGEEEPTRPQTKRFSFNPPAATKSDFADSSNLSLASLNKSSANLGGSSSNTNTAAVTSGLMRSSTNTIELNKSKLNYIQTFQKFELQQRYNRNKLPISTSNSTSVSSSTTTTTTTTSTTINNNNANNDAKNNSSGSATNSSSSTVNAEQQQQSAAAGTSSSSSTKINQRQSSFMAKLNEFNNRITQSNSSVNLNVNSINGNGGAGNLNKRLNPGLNPIDKSNSNSRVSKIKKSFDQIAGDPSSKQQQQNPIDKESSIASNRSDMDISSPMADVKQISVQNKPLGGKKLQLQNSNAFSANKFGIDTKQLASSSSSSSAANKYVSSSNMTLNNHHGANGHTNGGNNNSNNNNSMGSLTGVLNGHISSSNNNNSNNLTSNLVKTFLSSNVNNKSGLINTNSLGGNQNRSYFNHLNSTATANSNSMHGLVGSSGISNNASTFMENETNSLSLLPGEGGGVKQQTLNSSYNSSNTMPSHHPSITARFNASNAVNALAREKSNAQLVVNNSNNNNGSSNAAGSNNNINLLITNSNDRASRDSKIFDSKAFASTRKENTIYLSSKENASNHSLNTIATTSSANNRSYNFKTQQLQQQHSNIDANNSSLIGGSSNLNSNGGGGGHSSGNNAQSSNPQSRSSNSNMYRNILSSKQINSQTPTVHHATHKNDSLTAAEALQIYGDKLTPFEKSEINEYSEIWFLGLDAEKIQATTAKDYDDENGAYTKVIKDHIAYRYEILETLGKGSFGQVLKCFDHKRKEHVAVKIIRSKKRFQQQGMVEVNILQHLKNMDHDNALNVVHMKEYFYFRNHLCITFEILGINLYELIKKNNYQGFSIHLVRRFAYSILQCMKVMFREKIIHCDMKPENILLRQKGSSAIKVIDFGSGCFESQRIYTYIQSRFYRAPEIILGIPYTTSIDMWSLGCILAELFTGYPIFPGENEAEQLAMIMEVIDLPPSHVLAEASRRKLFFDSKNVPRALNSKMFKKRRAGTRSLVQVLKTTDANFVDFVARCLEWDPALRMTAEEALKHPWIMELKKKNSKDTRPKHRLRREAETSIEHENTHIGNFNNDNTFNEYHFQKQLHNLSSNNLLTNNLKIDSNDHDTEKSTTNSFFPPLH